MILSLKEKGETRFFDPISFSPSEKETNFATPFFSFSIRRKKRTVSHREEKKETTREPFGRFSGLSIDQSLALDLRRMEVGKSTIEYVGADEGIGPYKVQRKIEGCGRTESSTPTNAAKDVWEIHCGGE